MRLIFCGDPLDPRVPDPAYAEEVIAASGLSIAYSLVNFEVLTYDQDARKSVRRVEESFQEDIGVYRGWMLRPEQYARLYSALVERGIRLINPPADYRHCHYLPESYAVIADSTPKTVWMPVSSAVSIDAVMRLLEPFGAKPVIVKDYVKSQKHKWLEACFIPSAADREAVERVVERFLYLLCRVPPQFVSLTEAGITVNPVECFFWAADYRRHHYNTEALRQLEVAGLLI